MGLILAGTVLVTTLILAPGFFFYFDVSPKVVALLWGVAICLFLPRGKGNKTPLYNLLLLLSFVSIALSAALSPDRARSFYGGTWRRFGLVTQTAVLLFAWLVARYCAGHAERARIILRAIVLSVMVTAPYGIAQYFGWDPFVPRAAYHIGEGIWSIVRPPGTLGYASYFATFLLMAIFLALALEQFEKSAVWRWAARIATVVAIAAMLLTGTRAAILGLVCGAVFWAAGRVRRLFSWKAVAAVAILLLAAGSFYYSPPGQQLRSRVRWVSEDPWGGARLLLWRDSLSMASHRLVAGYGPEEFYTKFPHFESARLAEAYPDFVHESPHNIFLDALVAQGIPGCLILCALCALGLYEGWRKRMWAIAAALVAGIVSQQFTAFTAPTAVIFFTVLSLAVAGNAETASDENALPAHVVRIAGPLVAMGLLLVAGRIALADHALAETQRALNSGHLAEASAAYATYDRYRLPGSSADVWYSRACMELAHKTTDLTLVQQAVAEAEGAAERATRTAEDPFDAWYNLSEIRSLYNDYAGTERALHSAIAAHPNWFKPHWTLAQLLILEGRTPEAEIEASLAVELDGGKNPEVAETLAHIRGKPI